MLFNSRRDYLPTLIFLILVTSIPLLLTGCLKSRIQQEDNDYIGEKQHLVKDTEQIIDLAGLTRKELIEKYGEPTNSSFTYINKHTKLEQIIYDIERQESFSIVLVNDIVKIAIRDTKSSDKDKKSLHT